MAEDPVSRDQHRSDMAEPRLWQVHRCSTPFGINGIITPRLSKLAEQPEFKHEP
jgi:hypothetical protein